MKCCVQVLCKLLCDAAFEPIIVTDGEKVMTCNERVVKIFGYGSKEELLQLTMRQIINLHFEPSMMINEQGKECPASISSLTFANVKNDDCIKQAAAVKIKKWRIDGKCFYTIAIRDIPIIRLANERSLFKNKCALLDFDNEPQLQTRLLTRFAQMADALPSLVWIVSCGGEVLYQNIRVKEVFGVDTTLESWKCCIHPSDMTWFFPEWMEGFKNGRHTSFEVRYRSKLQDVKGEYTYRYHLFQTTPILNNGTVERFVCSAVDVQDLKEAEREKQRLIASEKLAMDASRLKSAFLSMMSHEICTPLFGIVGNVCLLMDTPITALQREYVENIDGSAKLMMAVIQDILDFSRIEAGKLRVSKEPFSFNRTLSICRGMVEQAARRKGLEFSMPPLDTQVKALGDPMRILQVLTNLASHAIKFTKQGRVAIDFEHCITEGILNAKITVSDTGIGISPELRAQLFTPWVQGDSSNRRLYGGSGLGLAISKALLEMMDGTISLESESGKGSRFWIELSLPALDPEHEIASYRSQSESPNGDAKFEFYLTHPPTPEPTTPPPEPKAKANDTPKKFQVLLAEDNPINQAILKRFLKKMGNIDCFLANDGQMALDEYLRQPPRYYHIILLDQSMPRMDGDMVCHHIRQVDQNQIIISVSANALLADHNNFSELGMNDHIPKPVDYASFSQVLTHWFDQIPTLYASPPKPK
ncbi:hypothetical protein DSO57_1027174 [Entomophthora muscae]|nr:hypothetical protein DSO57_1027174 [Entomophthora muscae]